MAEPDSDRDAARADLCRLLAACYYEPGPEFAEERVFNAMRDAAARIDADLTARARRVGDAFAAASLAELLVDYTRLFLGPVQALARPYGSVWLEADKGLMQDSTLAVQALYAEGGFEIADEFRELPDHVAAELEFLYVLRFKSAQARQSGDAESLAAMTGLRKRFLDRHLGVWVGPFAAAVQAGAQCAFYRELAGLTERLVGIEASA
jgi:putative dimethyl sulfoxide reductase chaperone